MILRSIKSPEPLLFARIRGYFLGEVTPELDKLTSQLAETYEAKVQFRKFTETLLAGCGPDCGTEAAAGQGGCESCRHCEVALACQG